MQFITVSIAALTLGANVLAAPTSLFHKAGDVVSTVEADLNSALNKKDLDLFHHHYDVDVSLEDRDVVSTVDSVPVAGPVVSEASSVVSELTPQTVLSILGSAVGTLKSELQTDLTSLSKLPPCDIVPRLIAN
jgi:hypothetical protein